ncbi:hypothetical protein SLEP1_g8646 [Rubroshorea leprosula]|uniref:Kinesin-like protein n=1 Tax=Rubroshorea leprosula TaxID=152421 RepID=A0AAV5I7Z7_9ROSI|nr:hypothetical protein SLEP1_g8646 [Rubroshorea leprosula]
MMNILKPHTRGNGIVNGSDASHDVDFGQLDNFKGMAGGNQQSSLVEWLNGVLPHLSLPLDASEEELRACLLDGTVFCSILNKLKPDSIDMGGAAEPGPANIKRFLRAMDEMGLPRFELLDLEQGYMVPVLQCLRVLQASFNCNGADSNQNPSRRRWNLSGIVEDIQLKQGCQIDISDAVILELTKSNSLENASTQSLCSVANKIMDDSIERKNGDIPHRMACLLRKIVQVIEWRISTRAENLKNQNNLYKDREEKYQSRMKALETLAKGTMEENKAVMNQLEQIKIEKTKLQEKEKLEEQDVLKLKKEKAQSDIEISKLREELKATKKTHEGRCLQLETQAEETRVQLERKLKELESLLMNSQKKVKELESFSESKYKRWKNRERIYRSFIDQQFGALKELREASESIKHDVLKTKRRYIEEFSFLGVKLKGLVDAAENYHTVLAENRKLYNEVQDLKGNIRVYCRIRPFLPGQSKKQTTMEFVGDNGELVVANPSKQGKDTHRLFKFNKVFGPTASQEEVFLDTQPLIRSVLDGYNVCIFAYGQTGSGKTYTMSGPNLSSEEDWGVNCRALNDLFQISQRRKNSILYEVGVQMVEIYNEQVRDLLTGDAVPEASMHSVRSTADVLELMNIGLMNRAVGATALNERSSRSHSVLTVHVRGTDLKTNSVLRGSLNLVDLAGSERVDRSEATGDRLREAQHINKSLSALGDVIFALAQKSTHVPYRNSKLTQVLQSSLGGQAKTLMFVQLNPDVDSYSETISTLKFAERVSGVELGAAKSNKEGRDIRELMEQVSSLKESIIKKDEEIEHLQMLSKGNDNGIKYGRSSVRYGSSSPRNHTSGTPRQSRIQSTGKGSGHFEKAASDMDNCSAYSDKHSEAGSPHSVDYSRPQKEFSPQSNTAGKDLGQNSLEDIELLGFGDADDDERLSDISDSVLSMGTETDGSICSAVEFTLFPEVPKVDDRVDKVEKAEKIEKVEKAMNIGKSSVASKIPKLPQKLLQTKSTQPSLARSSTSKVSSSSRKISAGGSSTKPSKRWQ